MADGSTATIGTRLHGKACGEIIGPTYGELAYTVLDGIKRGQMGQYSGRLLLESCLPDLRRPATKPQALGRSRNDQDRIATTA